MPASSTDLRKAAKWKKPALAFAYLCSVAIGLSQSGGSYQITHASLGTSNGNGTGGPYKVTSQVGSPAVTVASGGSIELTGGIRLGAPPAAQLLNIATRMKVLTGNNVLIAGFIVTGTEPKKVLVRGIGPSLAGFGVTGTVQNPTLELHDAAGTLPSNDDWKDNQQNEISATSLAPTNDRESAIVATVGPGDYTAILADKNGNTGIGLVEVYDLAQAASSQLANISTRGFIDTGDNVMIGGLILGPNGNGTTRVLVRGIGPSLAQAGITNPLQDPLLELHDANGNVIATNNDWKVSDTGGSQQAEIEATGLPPAEDHESALVRTLTLGNYTAILRGLNNTTGVGLVELYKLQ